MLLPRSSTIEVAASPPAVRLRPELAFQLHQAPDPGAVSADIRLYFGGQLADGGEVDAEQFRAALAKPRPADRPPIFGEGNAAERIAELTVAHLDRALERSVA